MQYTFLAVVALATAALAAPFPFAEKSQALNPRGIFTNASCSLPSKILGYPSLGKFFPTADKLGTIVGPVLHAAIGTAALEDVDAVAEDLCVSANQDPDDDVGTCDNILQTIFDLAQHAGQPAVSADKYRCLLDLICVAQSSPQNAGLCQKLLAGADCVANRIGQIMDRECEGKYAY